MTKPIAEMPMAPHPCADCQQPYQLNRNGRPSPRCAQCRVNAWKRAKRNRDRMPHALALEEDGIAVEKPQMRRCLAEDHDHLFLTTKAIRFCGAAKSHLALIDGTPSSSVLV